MNVETALARAMSALGQKTAYASPGVIPPLAASTWPTGVASDCSGFVSWCLRFSQSRKVDHPLYTKVNGGWFETTAIHRDGMEAMGYFRPLTSAQPGALIVYPDRVNSTGKSSPGHVGMVVRASGKGIAGVSEVIHCSSSNFQNMNDAVQVTDARPWLGRNDSILVWLEELDL